MKPFQTGRIVTLIKEPANDFDKEAIRVELPFIDTIGYVANSRYTVFEGTCSAGRLYDKFEDYAFAKVMFVAHSGVIAQVIFKEETEKDGEGREKRKTKLKKISKGKKKQ